MKSLGLSHLGRFCKISRNESFLEQNCFSIPSLCLYRCCIIFVGNGEFLENISKLVKLSPEMPFPAMVIYLLVLVEPKPEKLPLLIESLTKLVCISCALEI